MRLDGVREVEPFGAGLHVRVEGGRTDVSVLAGALDRAGSRGVEVAEIPPTLEDVFLAVARRGGAAA
jgi:ABC-2 type transport system ATP-binding protein